MLKNFDFSWFLTTPGILTGVGCLLILISIIIFISSLKGKKKEKVEDVKVENTVVPEVTPTVQGTAPVNFAATMEPAPLENNISGGQASFVEPTVSPVEPQVTPVTPVTPVASEPVAPVEMPQINIVPEEPVAQPISMEPVKQVEVQPINIEPTITPVTPSVAPQVAQPINIEPTIQPVAFNPASQVSTPEPTYQMPEVAPNVTMQPINIEPASPVVQPVPVTPVAPQVTPVSPVTPVASEPVAPVEMPQVNMQPTPQPVNVTPSAPVEVQPQPISIEPNLSAPTNFEVKKDDIESL